MRSCETKWRTVPAHASMLNGRADRIVGTIERKVGRILTTGSKEWDEVVYKVVLGYRRGPMNGGYSPFQLLYYTIRLLQQQDADLERLSQNETVVDAWPRRGQGQTGRRRKRRKNSVVQVQSGQLALMACGRLFKKGKWPSVKAK